MGVSLFFGDFWIDVIVGIVTFSIIFYRIWTWNYSYWKDRNVPNLQPTFPFGNTKDFVLSNKFSGHIFGEMYFKLAGNKYGGIINLIAPWLLVRDPEIIKQIITKDFNHFTDRGLPFDEENDPLSAHLFSLTGERWRSLRTKLTPTFTSGKMKMMFHLIKACGNELQKSLLGHAEKKDVIELKEFMARFGTDVIGSCAFGLDIDSLGHEDDPFRKYTKGLFTQRFGVIVGNLLNSIMPGLNRTFKIRTFPRDLENFFTKIVADTVEYREKNNVKRNDFLDLLIEIKNHGQLKEDELKENSTTSHLNGQETHHSQQGKEHNDIQLSNKLMTAQCFVFFIAGFETSSTTLSFCLYELALNKTIQKKLQDEIDKILAKYNGEISYESLKEMTYMDQVIQETLRKYPPVPNLLRECVEDYKLESSIDIRKGTRIIVPLYGLHYDPQYYPEPEKFDPERFTEEAKQSRHHYTWLPFGEGPRICIGMRFGILQVKTGLTAVLSKYNFDKATETQVPIEFNTKSFTPVAKNGIRLQISKRSK